MTMNGFSRVRGNALIDLVVFLACVSLLAGLAMPWLVQMRARKRLDHCTLQVRELCLGAHNFHDAFKSLPPATLGLDKAVHADVWATREESVDYWKNQQNSSFRLLVAPFMEWGRPYYEAVDPGAFNMFKSLAKIRRDNPDFTATWQGDIDGIGEAIEERIESLLCPEDDLQERELPAIIATQPCQPVEAEGMAAIDLANDIAMQTWQDSERPLGPTSYLGCIGALGGRAMSGDPEDDKWQGAMSSRSRNQLHSIGDGTSMTLMLGESLGDIHEGERTAAQSWVWGGAGRISGLVGPHTGTHALQEDHIGILGDGQFSSAVGFGSKHDGTVTFALCDGSVREISRDIDWQVLYQLAARADGNPIDRSRF